MKRAHDKITPVKLVIALALFCALQASAARKHIVLISGDEEYRSEEALPQLARILAKHHGFTCSVLFALDPDGTVNPNRSDNNPGLEALKKADLVILMTRFRDWPDDQMKHFVDYVESGRPIVALRTATHAFAFKNNKTYARWSWNSREPGWEGGFGKKVLGETWVSHHGAHGKQSTRAIIAPGGRNSPILRGIKDGDVWGPTDVYTAQPPADADVLLLGQVLTGMQPSDPPLEGPKNDPMMPVAWTRFWNTPGGKTMRVFTTTMGSSQDLENEGFRRLVVNAVYWGLGMEKKIRPNANVQIVGTYKPTPFGFNKAQKGRKPEDF
jgi:type 1 glutamine amidotransferase